MGTRSLKLTLLAWLCLGAKALAEDNRDPDAALVLEGGVRAELSGEGVTRVRGGLVVRDGASLVVRDGATLIIHYAQPPAAAPLAETTTDVATADEATASSPQPAAPVILTVPDDPPPAVVNHVTVNQVTVNQTQVNPTQGNHIDVVVEHGAELERLPFGQPVDEYVDETQGDALRTRGHLGLDFGVPLGGGRRFGFSGRLEARYLVDLDFSVTSFRGEHDQAVLGRAGLSVRFVELGVVFMRVGVGARMHRDPRAHDADTGFDGSVGLGLRGRRATLHVDGTFGRIAGTTLLASFRSELGISVRPRVQLVAGFEHVVLGAGQPNATTLTSPTVGLRIRMR